MKINFEKISLIVSLIAIFCIIAFAHLPILLEFIVCILTGMSCGVLGAYFDNKFNGGDDDVDKTS